MSPLHHNHGALESTLLNLAFTQSTLERLTNQSTNDHSPNNAVSISDVKLPRLNLPSFSGEYHDWVSFKNATLTDSHKLQYLKGSLWGEAATILKHLTITDANYVEAYQEWQFNSWLRIWTKELQVTTNDHIVSQMWRFISMILNKCPLFKTLNITSRKEFVAENDVCVNCLRKGHKVTNCRSSFCLLCKPKHHTL